MSLRVVIVDDPRPKDRCLQALKDKRHSSDDDRSETFPPIGKGSAMAVKEDAPLAEKAGWKWKCRTRDRASSILRIFWVVDAHVDWQLKIHGQISSFAMRVFCDH